MDEFHDNIKEFADANEPLIKHNLKKGSALSLIKALTMTTFLSAAVVMPMLYEKAEEPEIPSDNSQEVIDNSNTPDIPSDDKEENIETVELVPPAIASASANYRDDTSTISLVIDINDGILANASITLDGETYDTTVNGGTIILDINKKLRAGNHPITIVIPYVLGEKTDSLSQELNVFVEPIEPEINVASASYNKDSDTITFFNTITINDATNYKTKAYLTNGNGYNWYVMGDNASLTISNYLDSGSYSGFIEFNYQLLDEEKTIRKPFSVTIEKKEEEKQVVFPSFTIKDGAVFDSGDPPIMIYQIVGGVNDNGSGATDYEITSVKVNGQNTNLQEFYIDEGGFDVYGEFNDDQTGKYKVTISISYKIDGKSYSGSASATYEIKNEFNGSYLSANASAYPYPNNDHEAISIDGDFTFEFSGEYSSISAYMIFNGTSYPLDNLQTSATTVSYRGTVDDIAFDSAASSGPKVTYRLVIDGINYDSEEISLIVGN